ncbi:MAG TPA: RpoH suppressor, partial [Alphaproteobacteria bacterium]|nr:RpoH suppressor [Alphaproteobacteria bacterium]
AGAIAAALTAAAEHARLRGGFERLVTIPQELAGGLLAKFQPEPALQPLLAMLLAALEKPPGNLFRRLARIGGAALSGYWRQTVLALAAGAGVTVLGLVLGGGAWAVATGLCLALLLLLVLLAWRILRALTQELPAADFGLCSGRTIAGPDPAFTDWLAERLDEVAARGAAADASHPLTFADLEAGQHKVRLRMMTSDIAMGRPYELPFRDDLHFFSEAEFRRLFPDRVVDYMVRAGGRVLDDNDNPIGDLHHLPPGSQLPVVVAVRLSLSFPGLIQAVPLYKRDFLLKHKADRERPIRCLFSDGGLTSNFPIHLFDRLWPNRPTFAINLDSFNPKADEDRQRVWMHTAAGAGQILPIHPVVGLGGFFWALFNTAKGWQDALQAVLPGYRERIVHVALKPDEGGLNLDMDRATIETLLGFGAEAGRHVVQFFELDQHRWRRHLTAVARVEETLAAMFESDTDPCGGPDDFARFLARYDAAAGSYALRGASRAELDRKTADLFALARTWDPRRKLRGLKTIPRPESAMRISPKP